MSNDLFPFLIFGSPLPTSYDEWYNALTKRIDINEMFDWFIALTEYQVEKNSVFPGGINLYCAAQSRFRNVARYHPNLLEKQRLSLISTADEIVELVRYVWRHDHAMLSRFEAALSSQLEKDALYGWPSPMWEILRRGD